MSRLPCAMRIPCDPVNVKGVRYGMEQFCLFALRSVRSRLQGKTEDFGEN